jgi:hypothetical protein
MLNMQSANNFFSPLAWQKIENFLEVGFSYVSVQGAIRTEGKLVFSIMAGAFFVSTEAISIDFKSF